MACATATCPRPARSVVVALDPDGLHPGRTVLETLRLAARIIGATPDPIGTARSVTIEFRKLAGTTGGRALLLTNVALAAAAATLGAAAPSGVPILRVADAYDLAAAPLILLVPITVLVAFTAEWTTRSSVLTCILTPRRHLVFAGKVGLAAVLSVAAPLVSLAFAVVATQIMGLLRGRM